MPTYLVFDSTALCRTYCMRAADWDSLSTNADRWGVRMAVPWTAVEETIANFERNIDTQKLGTYRLATAARSTGVTLQVGLIIKHLDKQRARYRRYLKRRLASLGIEVLPVKGISHKEVVGRAVQRRRPCDDAGNGYRDTLNWLTVLALALKYPDHDVIWISEDSDFRTHGSGPFHEHLAADLADRGLTQRVTLQKDLSGVTKFVHAKHLDSEKANVEWAELSRVATTNILKLLNTARPELRVIECGLPSKMRSAPATLTAANAEKQAILDRLDDAGETKLVPFTLSFTGRCGLRIYARPDAAAVAELDDSGEPAEISKDLIATGYVIVTGDDVVDIVDVSVEAPEDDLIRRANSLENSRRETLLRSRITGFADYLGVASLASEAIGSLNDPSYLTFAGSSIDAFVSAYAALESAGLTTELSGAAELVGPHESLLAAARTLDNGGVLSGVINAAERLGQHQSVLDAAGILDSGGALSGLTAAAELMVTQGSVLDAAEAVGQGGVTADAANISLSILVGHSMTDLLGEILRSLTGVKMDLAEARSGSKKVHPACGLYAIHAEADVWNQLGLGIPPDDCQPLYVGKAEASLAGRDVRQHFTGKTGSSTVRRALAGLLAADLDLMGVPRNPQKPDRSSNFALTDDGEARLSAWMEHNLKLAVWPAVGDVVLKDLEEAAIEQLVPALNLKHNRKSPWRQQVSDARAVLAAQSRANLIE